MSLSNKTKRERNVAHLWVDKRVSRFIRRNFKGKQRRTLRDVYLALCEIESDFTQQRNNPNFGIPHLGKLCATYSGITEETAYEAMGAFKKMGLIDYAQNKGEKGQYGKGSYLTLWTWDDEENYIENLNSPVPGETRDRVLPVPGETRDRLSPGSVKPGNFKNPSGEKQESFQEGKARILSGRKAARSGTPSDTSSSIPFQELIPTDHLHHPKFREAWKAYDLHRQKKDKKGWHEGAVLALFQHKGKEGRLPLKDYPPEVVAEMLWNTIAGGWTGVFKSEEKKPNGNGSGPSPAPAAPLTYPKILEKLKTLTQIIPKDEPALDIALTGALKSYYALGHGSTVKVFLEDLEAWINSNYNNNGHFLRKAFLKPGHLDPTAQTMQSFYQYVREINGEY